MKILLVNDRYPPEATTTGMITADLAREYRKRGHDVTIFTTGSVPGPTTNIEDGITVHRIPRKERREFYRFYVTLFNRPVWVPFRDVLTQVRPEVVHFHNTHLYLSYYLLRIAKKHGAKVFVTLHDMLTFHYGKLSEHIVSEKAGQCNAADYRVSAFAQLRKFKRRFNPLRRFIIRYYLGFADGIFSVSNKQRDALHDNGVVVTQVVYNGIEPGIWRVESDSIESFRKEHALENQKTVAFAGRFNWEKGIHQIIRAFARAHETIPDSALLLIGERNALANDALTLARSLGVEQRIIFTGFLDQRGMAAAFRNTDVLAFPSVYLDPFGMVIIEAMACALPVVVSCLGGASEIVQDNETGFVVDPYDTESFAERLATLLSSRETRKRMGAAGLERVKKYYSLELQADRYLKAFEQ